MTNLLERKDQLTKRLAALTDRIEGIDAELLSHDSKDWSEQATERESDEVLEHIALEAGDEILAIRAALTRIDAGTYGQCQTCGAAISSARLDVLPFTPFCKDCAI